MFGKRYEILKLFGISIRLDLSWFVIVALISWSLADSFFPAAYPQLTPLTYWAMGLTGALGLFASVLIHELAHALTARQFGLSIRGITLFIFGGVAEMDSEPPNPWAEFVVAIAGPVASVILGLSSFAVAMAGAMAGWPMQVFGVTTYLGYINLVLAVFNMVPAFPLDGGRVLRSALWHWKKDLRWATHITASIGRGFGTLLIAFGILRVILGDLMGGWMALIGMFLRNAAQMSYRQVLLKRSLEGEKVHRFMRTEPVVVPRSLPISELVDDYVYRHHFKMFPVVDDDRLLGYVETKRIRELPQSEWRRQSVGTIMTPCSPANTVAPETDALEALALMSRTGSSRLMVVDDSRLVGIIALKDLLKFLALKVELEGPSAA